MLGRVHVILTRRWAGGVAVAGGAAKGSLQGDCLDSKQRGAFPKLHLPLTNSHHPQLHSDARRGQPDGQFSAQAAMQQFANRNAKVWHGRQKREP